MGDAQKLACLNVRLWPVVACHDQDSINARPSAPRRKRSFKDGLTEQMSSFDECRLSPISGSSDHVNLNLATGRVRPTTAVRAAGGAPCVATLSGHSICMGGWPELCPTPVIHGSGDSCVKPCCEPRSFPDQPILIEVVNTKMGP